MTYLAAFTIAGVRYVLLPYEDREPGSDPCAGCVGWDGRTYTPLCDQLPECAGGTWRVDDAPLFAPVGEAAREVGTSGFEPETK